MLLGIPHCMLLGLHRPTAICSDVMAPLTTSTATVVEPMLI